MELALQLKVVTQFYNAGTGGSSRMMMAVPKDISSPRGMLWLLSCGLAGWNEMKFWKGK